MLEDTKPESQNSEINLNLNIPQDESDKSFTFKDLVLLVYNARKSFLIWTCIGIVLGLAAAAWLYFSSSGRTAAPAVLSSSEVSVSLILSYSNPEQSIFPDGSAFDVGSLYNPVIWENALKNIGRSDISLTDAMSQVDIVNIGYIRSMDELARIIAELPGDIPTTIHAPVVNNYFTSTAGNRYNGNTYTLTIATGNKVFNSTEEKEDFLLAFCDEFRNYITLRYFNSDISLMMLRNRPLRNWIELTSEDIVWDSFDYSINMRLIGDRYDAILQILDVLILEDNLYVSAEGKSFVDYADDIRAVTGGSLAQWKALIDTGAYIRNIERFKEEYEFEIYRKRADYQYYLDLFTTNTELLYSFRQSFPATGSAGIAETNELLGYAKDSAVLAAELNRDIRRLEYLYEAIENDENAIRTRSRDAETALAGFISGLEEHQTTLSEAIYSYYKQLAETDAENAIQVTNLRIAGDVSGSTGSTGNRSLAVIAFVFVACVGICIAVAFMVTVVKKNLPERSDIAEEMR